jgi:hypothetical protein
MEIEGPLEKWLRQIHDFNCQKYAMNLLLQYKSQFSGDSPNF